MKRIEAIIGPDTVSNLCEALSAAGVRDVTVSSVERRESGQEWVHVVRSAAYKENTRVRARVEVIANDADADTVVQFMRTAAASGGGGQIFIHNVADIISIGTAGHF